jgi:hypothetical protein
MADKHTAAEVVLAVARPGANKLVHDYGYVVHAFTVRVAEIIDMPVFQGA